MSSFPCPVCQKPLKIRWSKKDKPYVVCACGVQMFVRYEAGIERLERLCRRDVSLLDGFVLCRECEVAVKKSLQKIKDPLLGKAGIYCPECGEFLIEAPSNWREK